MREDGVFPAQERPTRPLSYGRAGRAARLGRPSLSGLVMSRLPRTNYTGPIGPGQAPADAYSQLDPVVILATGQKAGQKVGRSLVLNATSQPLVVVPARRAVVLVLKEK